MKQIHRDLLDFWKKLLPILENNNIRYWAIGGTAIGALREGGFIEWDDDIDICVAEEDMDKLMNTLKKNGINTSSKYLKFNPYPFEKAFDTKETSSFGERDNLYIDIFPGFVERKWTKIGWLFFRVRDNLLYVKSKLLRNWIKGSDGRMVYFGLLTAKLLISIIPRWALINGQKKSLSKVRIRKNANKDLRYSYFLDNDKPFNISKLKVVNFEDSRISINDSFAEDMYSVFGDIYSPPDKQKNHKIKPL